MNVKIISYPCCTTSWCTGKVGELVRRFSLPEPGVLVKFEGQCPHKSGFPGQPAHTECFIEDSKGKYVIV